MSNISECYLISFDITEDKDLPAVCILSKGRGQQTINIMVGDEVKTLYEKLTRKTVNGENKTEPIVNLYKKIREPVKLSCKPYITEEEMLKHPIKNNEYLFKDEYEAKDVLDTLKIILNDYGCVTIENLKKTIGLREDPKSDDSKLGWVCLNTARISGIREGFMLYLPEPIKL